MRQLTSLDAQFLAVESARIYGHVAFLGIYDPSTAPGGRLDMQSTTQLLRERLHLLPPLRWRLVEVPLGLDLPYWTEDPDFDLDFHVRETAVPAPGDDRVLAGTVAPLFGRPLDRNRPLWELYVIHGLPHGRVAMLTKIHHSVVDGISGNEIMATLLDPEREGRVIPPASERGKAQPVPGDRRMLLRGLRGLPRQPVRALTRLPATAAAFTDLPGANALPGVPALSRALSRLRRDPGAMLEVTTARPPRTPFNGPVSAHRRFAFGSLSLSAVRQIRREFGTTVNDVVVAMCAGSGRDWLRHGRGARLAAGARRAPRRPARGDDPHVGAPPRRARRLGRPHLDDDRADPDQRAGPAPAPGAHPRAPAQREGAPHRAARLAADRRDGLHPAGGRRARGAQHGRHPQPHAAAAEPRDLQRAGPAHLALL